jgi:hypothetical protein
VNYAGGGVLMLSVIKLSVVVPIVGMPSIVMLRVVVTE